MVVNTEEESPPKPEQLSVENTEEFQREPIAQAFTAVDLSHEHGES